MSSPKEYEAVLLFQISTNVVLALLTAIIWLIASTPSTDTDASARTAIAVLECLELGRMGDNALVVCDLHFFISGMYLLI